LGSRHAVERLELLLYILTDAGGRAWGEVEILRRKAKE